MFGFSWNGSIMCDGSGIKRTIKKSLFSLQLYSVTIKQNDAAYNIYLFHEIEDIWRSCAADGDIVGNEVFAQIELFLLLLQCVQHCIQI